MFLLNKTISECDGSHSSIYQHCKEGAWQSSFVSINGTNTHTHTNTLSCPSVAPGDYGALINLPLGPFNNDVRQLSFNVSIVNDSIPEDAEMFNVSLTLDPADQAILGNCSTVSPDVATVTIQDNDGT